MSPQGMDDPEFATRDKPLLRRAAPRRDQHVFINSYDERLGHDARERLFEIATGHSAHVTALPFPGHAKQIIGVHREEIIFNEPSEEIIEGGELQPAP